MVIMGTGFAELAQWEHLAGLSMIVVIYYVLFIRKREEAANEKV